MLSVGRLVFSLVLFAFLWMAPGVYAQADAAARIHEVKLAGIDPATWDVNTFIVSPDNRHIACVVRKGPKFVVYNDSVAGQTYDEIGQGSLSFFPDGASVAYAARRGSDWFPVIKGQEGTIEPGGAPISRPSLDFAPQFAKLSDGRPNVAIAAKTPVVSSGGKRVAYIAHRPQGVVVVVDGKESKFYRQAGGFSFSPDEKRVAYLAKAVGQDPVYAVIDGQGGSQYVDAYAPVFSPDSKHVAYVAVTSRRPPLPLLPLRSLVVFDGIPQTTFETIDPASLKFSPDGSHLAYAGQTGESWVVMLDGKPQGTYSGIAGPSIVFSSDGKHIAYAAQRRKEWVVVVDGQEQRPYEAVGKLALSPDGASLVFIGRRGGSPVLVANGAETARYDEIYDIAFSPDSKHWAAIVKWGGQYMVVRDGKVGGGYPGLGTVLVFSPDSSHLAYVVVRGEKAAVALDGVLGKDYDTIMQPDMALVKFVDNATVRYLAIEGGALLSVDQTAW